MGLDIEFVRRKKTVCPECGATVGHTDVDYVGSGGRVWYSFLEPIGYYVPYDKRTEENNWYGKDMILAPEQARYAHRFAQENDVYNGHKIAELIATAAYEDDAVVIRADW